ncbi:Hypothetical predicted protein [Marmota monax]|uniref:Uncharacterized protein n=1 Tax=Marmota monax TaxID=9995 RepID=A0A5E4A5C3_MARMO|nr:hypothetical protein GHT09_016995 [Marmota monax]VTJ52447.1 Hypothetical predicted protein [Marmota monax]
MCLCVVAGNAPLNNLSFHWLAVVHEKLILSGQIYINIMIKGCPETSNLFCSIRQNH